MVPGILGQTFIIGIQQKTQFFGLKFRGNRQM
jgi:hypothetical protein